MEEQLISFETAKLAKEKGFNWECSKYINVNNIWTYGIEYVFKTDNIHIQGHTSVERWLSDGINKCLEEAEQFENKTCSLDEIIIYPAPTQSLLQKWLREKHKLFVEIFTANYAWNNKIKFYFHVREIHSKNDDKYHNYRTEFVGTYEEALEKGLQEALKLINKTKEI